MVSRAARKPTPIASATQRERKRSKMPISSCLDRSSLSSFNAHEQTRSVALQRSDQGFRISRCWETVDCASGSSSTISPQTQVFLRISIRTIFTRAGCPSALESAASYVSAVSPSTGRKSTHGSGGGQQGSVLSFIVHQRYAAAYIPSIRIGRDGSRRRMQRRAARHSAPRC